MDAIAAAAGVGKGTLFRRFGDRARRWRARCSTSASAASRRRSSAAQPPLGPGAPPRERLIAFGERCSTCSTTTRAILAAAEVGRRALPPSAAYAVYRTHVALLLREADPDARRRGDRRLPARRAARRPDPAPAHEREIETERIAAAWEALVCRVIR